MESYRQRWQRGDVGCKRLCVTLIALLLALLVEQLLPVEGLVGLVLSVVT